MLGSLFYLQQGWKTTDWKAAQPVTVWKIRSQSYSSEDSVRAQHNQQEIPMQPLELQLLHFQNKEVAAASLQINSTRSPSSPVSDSKSVLGILDWQSHLMGHCQGDQKSRYPPFPGSMHRSRLSLIVWKIPSNLKTSNSEQPKNMANFDYTQKMWSVRKHSMSN